MGKFLIDFAAELTTISSSDSRKLLFDNLEKRQADITSSY